MRRAKLAFCTVVAATSCGPHYQAKGPMRFEEVPYTSEDGRPWPERKATLLGVAQQFGLARPPVVTYVDLNPSAEKTLVFIHGLGSSLKFWRHQLDHFAERGFRVLAADMIGYGKSDKPADFPYTMPAMAEVYRELLGQLEVNEFVLIGHSMGGQTAMAYAIAHPEEVKTMVLVSPAGFERFSPRDRRWFTSVFTTTLVKAASEDDLYGSIRYNNFSRWQDRDAWLIEERARVALTPEFDAYAYANVRSVHGLLETDYIRSNLGRIRARTLIAYGTDDRLIPNRFMHGGTTGEIMEFGAAGIEGAEVARFPGCGHTLQIDCETALNGALERFLGDGGSR